jgi:Zn finger protein HypA/HybF involved in hydrogenase expression
MTMEELTVTNYDENGDREPLSPEEREARMEQHIIAFFVELAHIRSSRRLYRGADGTKTFEEYARQRWNLGRRRGDQLAAAGEIISIIGTIGSEPVIAPTNERQVRPLVAMRQAGVSDEYIIETWGQVVEENGGKPPPAHKVESRVKQYLEQRRLHSSASGIPGRNPDPRHVTMEQCAAACSKAAHRIMHSQAVADDIYAAVMVALNEWDKATPRASDRMTVEIVETQFQCQVCGAVSAAHGGPLYHCQDDACGGDFVADENKEVECPTCGGAVRFIAERSCLVCKEGDVLPVDAVAADAHPSDPDPAKASA